MSVFHILFMGGQPKMGWLSWPWLLHEKGVSMLFRLSTVLENANISCSMGTAIVLASQQPQHCQHCQRWQQLQFILSNVWVPIKILYSVIWIFHRFTIFSSRTLDNFIRILMTNSIYELKHRIRSSSPFKMVYLQSKLFCSCCFPARQWSWRQQKE